jgi:phosphoheptose isomerase
LTTTNIDLIAKSGDLMVNALKNKNKIISCGNGGSMCDAMHFAEELTGRFRENRKPIAAFQFQTHHIFLVLVMTMVLMKFFQDMLKLLVIKVMFF